MVKISKVPPSNHGYGYRSWLFGYFHKILYIKKMTFFTKFGILSEILKNRSTLYCSNCSILVIASF